MRGHRAITTVLGILLSTALVSGCGAGGEQGEVIARQMKSRTDSFARTALPKFATAVDGGYQTTGQVIGSYGEGDALEGSPTYYTVEGPLQSPLSTAKTRDRLRRAMRDLGLKVNSKADHDIGTRPGVTVDLSVATYGMPTGSAALVSIRSDEHRFDESVRFGLSGVGAKVFEDLPSYP